MKDSFESPRVGQRLLLSEIGRQLAKFGFSEKPEGQAFFRETSIGWQALHISFIKHSGEFDATASVAIRVAALEEMIDVEDAKRPRKEQMASFAADLGNIANDERIRWTISGRGDVEPAASSIVEAFERVGLPYLDRYSDVNKMLNAVIPNDRSAWLHVPFHDLRCKRILGLAVLAGRSKEFELLRGDCQRFLEKRNDAGLRSFEAFAARAQPGPASAPPGSTAA